jgi:uncharacterized SAM-dependent methyltransferase
MKTIGSSYYKSKDLKEIYGVSRQTVSKWIESVKNGKLNLETIDENGQSYIRNTPANNVIIAELVKSRQKFKNTKSLRTIAPTEEFYKLYSPEQITDIIVNLRVHHEIPRQYNYIDEGAAYWDKYSTKLFNDSDANNPLHSTEELMQLNKAYLDELLSQYKKVNVVDIGPGNALPVKSLLSHLIDHDKLGRYTAIDISPEMLEIAHQNIKRWFNDKVDFVAELKDVNFERFTDLLMTDSPDEGSVNLVLFFGGTLHNLRSIDEALRTIYHSMTPPDIFICPLKLDTEDTRRNFHFNAGLEAQSLPPQHKFLVDLLGIEPDLYEVEIGFDEETHSRYLRLRLKVSLTINIELQRKNQSIHLSKNDTLLVWRYWHQTAQEIIEQFERNGFGVLQATQTKEHDCMLTICDVKPER